MGPTVLGPKSLYDCWLLYYSSLSRSGVKNSGPNNGETMSRTFSGMVVSVMLFCGLGRAQAESIMFTFDGTGSGTLDGIAFTDEAFTIRVIADTLDVVRCSAQVVSLDSLYAEIFIAGFEVAAFSISTRVFDSESGVLGFALSFSQGFPCSGGDLLDIRDNAFAIYDLTTSIGPIFDQEPFAVDHFQNIRTSGGILTMLRARDITFHGETESGTGVTVKSL